jgi:hypothetical protein
MARSHARTRRDETAQRRRAADWREQAKRTPVTLRHETDAPAASGPCTTGVTAGTDPASKDGMSKRCEHGWTAAQGCRECVPYDRNDVRDRMEGPATAAPPLGPTREPDAELGDLSGLCNIDPNYGTKGV